MIMLYGDRWSLHSMLRALFKNRIAESLGFMPETNIALYVNYTSIIEMKKVIQDNYDKNLLIYKYKL